MAAEKAEAFILRITDFSETSRIVVLFSREFGRLSALAKGGRRLKGPFESSLDLLANVRVVFLKKTHSQLDLLTEAQLIQRFQPHPRDVVGYYAGYYVAELLLSLTEDYDPHPDLYAATSQALTDFGTPELVRKALLRFELVLLREIGQLPDFSVCVGCGAELKTGRPFGYWVSQGGLICPDCQQEGYAQILVHAGTAAALRQFSGDSEAWRRLSLSAGQLAEMRQVTLAALSSILGHRPKMLKFLSEPSPKSAKSSPRVADQSDGIDEGASMRIQDTPSVAPDRADRPLDG